MKFGRARHVPYSFSFFYCSGVSVYMYNVLCFVSGRDVIRGGGAPPQLKAAKQARGAATERANLLVRDAAPALEEVIRMREDAHAQR